MFIYIYTSSEEVKNTIHDSLLVSLLLQQPFGYRFDRVMMILWKGITTTVGCWTVECDNRNRR